MPTTTSRPRKRVQRLSRTANQAARAIVQRVEAETGKTLTLQTSLNIVRVIQTCMDEVATVARAKAPACITVSNRRLYQRSHEALEHLVQAIARDEIAKQQRPGGFLSTV